MPAARAPGTRPIFRRLHFVYASVMIRSDSPQVWVHVGAGKSKYSNAPPHTHRRIKPTVSGNPINTLTITSAIPLAIASMIDFPSLNSRVRGRSGRLLRAIFHDVLFGFVLRHLIAAPVVLYFSIKLVDEFA